MCLYPKLIKNRKYTANKKNGGNIPAVNDERTKYVAIGCQNCLECRKKKSREWQVRLQEDIKEHTNGKFITLTFNNESICKITTEIRKKQPNIEGYNLDNEIATWAVRHFLERWRKKHKKSVRHWLVTELGHNGTENIHLHGIVWCESLTELEFTWQYGWVWKGKKIKPTINNREGIENYVNAKTINYSVKYVNKIDDKHPHYKSIILASAGIGGSYTKRMDSIKNKYKEKGTRETYRTESGHKISLPIYYRNKLYTEEEREKLWIEKLDKNERWVLGSKIDISNGEEEYNKALQAAQKINEELGYRGSEKNWEQEQYERERRNLKQAERMKR